MSFWAVLWSNPSACMAWGAEHASAEQGSSKPGHRRRPCTLAQSQCLPLCRTVQDSELTAGISWMLQAGV